ncbi:MAG: hypothetical protein ABUL73_01275 [Alphaproteobacteria bacterium]
MRTVFAIAFLCVVSGCATQLPAPTSTFDNIQQTRASNIAPLSLGAFGAGPSLPAGREHGLSFRADTLHPPTGGTFSGYLRETIAAELTAAGKLDPNSQHVLSGQLTRSEASTFGSQSRGELGARFQLTNGGTVVFNKEIVVDDTWPSAFMGATAIPDAENHYSGLYPKLFAALLADAEFRAAAQ